jgi:hypothetical protein
VSHGECIRIGDKRFDQEESSDLRRLVLELESQSVHRCFVNSLVEINGSAVVVAAGRDAGVMERISVFFVSQHFFCVRLSVRRRGSVVHRDEISSTTFFCIRLVD